MMPHPDNNLKVKYNWSRTWGTPTPRSCHFTYSRAPFVLRTVYTCDFWCDFWCDFAYKTRLTLPSTGVFFFFAKHRVGQKWLVCFRANSLAPVRIWTPLADLAFLVLPKRPREVQKYQCIPRFTPANRRAKCTRNQYSPFYSNRRKKCRTTFVDS